MRPDNLNGGLRDRRSARVSDLASQCRCDLGADRANPKQHDGQSEFLGWAGNSDSSQSRMCSRQVLSSSACGVSCVCDMAAMRLRPTQSRLRNNQDTLSIPDFKRNSRECIMETANGCEIETSGHELASHASSLRRRTSHGSNSARAHAGNGWGRIGRGGPLALGQPASGTVDHVLTMENWTW